jgi:hypothetical protein
MRRSLLFGVVSALVVSGSTIGPAAAQECRVDPGQDAQINRQGDQLVLTVPCEQVQPSQIGSQPTEGQTMTHPEIFAVDEVDASPGPAVDAPIAATDPFGTTSAVASGPSTGQATGEAAGGVIGQTGPGFSGQEFAVVGTFERIIYVASAQEAQSAFFGGQTTNLRASTDPQAKPYGLFLQTDATGSDAYLMVDLSWLEESTGEPGFADLQTDRALGGQHESVQLQLRQLPDNSFLAIEYSGLAKGSMVNNTDFGVQERMTVYDDAINAAGNCDDDENCGFFDEEEQDEDEEE